MRRTLLIFILLLALSGAAPGRSGGTGAIPPLFPDPGAFVAAITSFRPAPLPHKITGLTVPHHFLAADLIAQAFALAATQDCRRIIILSPDHFRRSATPFAVTRRDFATALGRLTTDRAAVARLMANPLVSESDLFSHEHGVQTLLPFIAHYFPRAAVVPVALHPGSRVAQWDSLAASLAPLLTPRTLVLQSTDFSHHLPHQEAQSRDRETLAVLSRGEPQGVLGLTEPAHLDCRAAQYLQLLLQQAVFGATPTVAAHRNSQEYTVEPLPRTTSYIVQIYAAPRRTAAGSRRHAGAPSH